MENNIIKIPRKQFRKLVAEHKDYIGKAHSKHEFNGRVCNVGDWCGFANILTGIANNGPTLIFEHIHFEIV